MPVQNVKHLTFITPGSLSVDYSLGNKCLAKFESYKKSCYQCFPPQADSSFYFCDLF